MASITDDNISLDARTESTWQQGYPTLAGYMSKAPESTILRRFVALNTQNLLYYQAELISLEKQLRQQESEAAQTPSCDPRSRFARDWDWLSMTATDGCMSTQMMLAKRLRVVLREYSM